MAPSPRRIRASSSSLRFRLKSSPSPFLFRAHAVERGFVAPVLRLIYRSLLRGSWHLPRGLTISLAGCRGFTGPVPPPLSMSAAGRPACLSGNYIIIGGANASVRTKSEGLTSYLPHPTKEG